MMSRDSDTSQNTPTRDPGPEFGFGTTIEAPFDDALARVTEVLEVESFGVLTTIDVQATMKA